MTDLSGEKFGMEGKREGVVRGEGKRAKVRGRESEREFMLI